MLHALPTSHPLRVKPRDAAARSVAPALPQSPAALHSIPAEMVGRPSGTIPGILYAKPGDRVTTTAAGSAPSVLDKTIAGVAVVIDAVLFLQFLDIAQGRFRMRPDTLICMQQHLLQAAIYTHALVFGQVLE